MSDWQPIETAPKDGRVVLLATDYKRGGHDRVRCAYWNSSRTARWIFKDKDTQVRDGWNDTSCWHEFVSLDAGAQEWIDEEDRTFVRAFDPTHWMPLPEPPK